MKLSSVSHTRELGQRGEGGLSMLVSLLVLIGIGWAVWHYFIRTDYSKPWWNGTSRIRACKTPYYDKSECYVLVADSDGKKVTTLYFENDGYFNIIDSHCYKAADDSIGRFCSFNDTDGTRWDILP